jgi:hypothetical protein
MKSRNANTGNKSHFFSRRVTQPPFIAGPLAGQPDHQT